MLSFPTTHSIVQDSLLGSRNWSGNLLYLSRCTAIEDENYSELIYGQDSRVFSFVKNTVAVGL